MKKTLPRLSLARETLRRLDPAVLHQAGGGRAAQGTTEPDFTSDITNCYICPVYPITTENA
jgi:hypothetical protein